MIQNPSLRLKLTAASAYRAVGARIYCEHCGVRLSDDAYAGGWGLCGKCLTGNDGTLRHERPLAVIGQGSSRRTLGADAGILEAIAGSPSEPRHEFQQGTAASLILAMASAAWVTLLSALVIVFLLLAALVVVPFKAIFRKS